MPSAGIELLIYAARSSLARSSPPGAGAAPSSSTASKIATSQLPARSPPHRLRSLRAHVPSQSVLLVDEIAQPHTLQIDADRTEKGDPGSDGASVDEEQDSLDLLYQALRWLKADVYGEFHVHQGMVSPEASMFGAVGSEEVLGFKRRWLTEKVNYEVDAVYDVDYESRVCVASFRCLIPGKEGKGVDVIRFDEQLRVLKVEALRY